MASSVFAELREKGLSKTTILSYIDSLTNQGILLTEDAELFKSNVSLIIGSSGEEFQTEKNSDGSLQHSLKTVQEKEKKGFLEKVFGGHK